MAFEFFRRRQKMVMIIMAILMVAFLLPVGLSNMSSMGGKTRTLGQTAAGDKLTSEDIQKAQSDMRLIEMLPGRNPRMEDFEILMELAAQKGRNANEVYALLLKEAQRSGMIALDADVDEFLKGAGDPKDQDSFKQYVFGMLKQQKIKPEAFYAAMRNWLLIDKYFNASAPSAPPSDQELRQEYRNYNERLKVRAAIIPADKFAKDVKEPSAEEIEKQFTEFHTNRPGEFSAHSQVGFGYAQPDRVQVQYAVVNDLPIQRVMVPSEDNVRKYFMDNRLQFVTKPQEDDKGNPVAGSGKQMDFAQAKPEIITKLSNELAGSKIDELLAQVQQSVSAAASQPAPTNPYASTINKMIDKSPAVLDKQIDVEIQAQPLDKAIEAVAQAAGLKAIVYPYGGTGKTTLSPSLQVTLVKSQARLEDVLASITAQVKWQPIKWATLAGFEGDLFPLSVGADASGAGDTSFFPLVAGDSGSVNAEQMFSNPLLGHCFVSPSSQEKLINKAFSSEPLLKGRENPGAMKVGAQGPRMYVIMDGPTGRELTGRLVWTLVSAVPGYEPQAMDEDIRQQVIKDLKQKAAFDMAMDFAKALKDKVQQGQDLGTLAKAAGLEVQDSGFISRVEAHYGQQPTPGKVPGLEAEDTLTRRLPFANYNDLASQVLQQTFELVPRPGEQATTAPAATTLSAVATSPATAPQLSSAARSATSPAAASRPSTMPGASNVVIIPMRWSNQVVVVQRLDYRPALLARYLESALGLPFPLEMDRKILKDREAMGERRLSAMVWFDYSAVAGRTGFAPEPQEK